jgi:Alpha/beta hydrolase of unknown function (DUF900)
VLAQIKNPRRGQAKGVFHPDLLAGMFNVARNPVTNRHIVLQSHLRPGTCCVKPADDRHAAIISLSQHRHNLVQMRKHKDLGRGSFMALIRINAQGETPVLHGSPHPVASILKQTKSTDGPVIVMTHGYKFAPDSGTNCPHRDILSLPQEGGTGTTSQWPYQLGFGQGNQSEGLAIAFAWDGRCALWQALYRAKQAGKALAKVLCIVHRQNPQRPIHILCHSMGVEVALETLFHIPPGAVDRIISMTGATYQSRLVSALSTPSGRQTEFFNITSRENDIFDFLYERMMAPRVPGDQVIGHGLDLSNALTLQLDCPKTLLHCARLGQFITPAQRRISHWSSYLRPGTMQFYQDLLRQREKLTLDLVRRGLPKSPAPRWSRLFARPTMTGPLFLSQKPS